MKFGVLIILSNGNELRCPKKIKENSYGRSDYATY